MARAAPRMPQQGTRPEKRLGFALRALGAAPWEASPRDMHGTPDMVWRAQEVLVFVDGCQWHRCPLHFRAHAGNDSALRPHGLTRLGADLQAHRDRVTRRAYQARGFTVLSFWEHEIDADAGRCAGLVLSALEARERIRCRG